MKIPIKTTKEKLYRQILEVLKLFPPVSNLRPKELTVLAELMKQNEEYRTLSKTKRRMIMLSKESKKEIQDKFNISPAYLNNILTTLRKYRILNKDGSLITVFDVIPQNKFTIEIELISYETEDNKGYNSNSKDKI